MFADMYEILCGASSLGCTTMSHSCGGAPSGETKIAATSSCLGLYRFWFGPHMMFIQTLHGPEHYFGELSEFALALRDVDVCMQLHRD